MAGPAEAWGVFEEEVDKVIAERPSEYDLATVHNVREFGAEMRSRGVAAPLVDPGYWPTFRLVWVGRKDLEIEVFDDHFEVYRDLDGDFDIRCENRARGQAFPTTLFVDLPLAAGKPNDGV